ncbi:MAG: exodeoxyribonuclease VII small subunit [Bacteroidaceae bacterium]|nr:exodeoxyribonuclease VII small subunit [Bacteroidaceae bacterium]
MNEQLTYTDAMKELEQLVAQLEDNLIDIDVLSCKVKRAQELIKFCKDKLIATDAEIKKVMEEGN